MPRRRCRGSSSWVASCCRCVLHPCTQQTQILDCGGQPLSSLLIRNMLTLSPTALSVWPFGLTLSPHIAPLTSCRVVLQALLWWLPAAWASRIFGRELPADDGKGLGAGAPTAAGGVRWSDYTVLLQWDARSVIAPDDLAEWGARYGEVSCSRTYQDTSGCGHPSGMTFCNERSFMHHFADAVLARYCCCMIPDCALYVGGGSSEHRQRRRGAACSAATAAPKVDACPILCVATPVHWLCA